MGLDEAIATRLDEAGQGQLDRAIAANWTGLDEAGQAGWGHNWMMSVNWMRSRECVSRFLHRRSYRVTYGNIAGITHHVIESMESQCKQHMNLY